MDDYHPVKPFARPGQPSDPGEIILSAQTQEILDILGIDLSADPGAIQPGDLVGCIKADNSNLITQGFVYVIFEIKESDGITLALVGDNRSLGSSTVYTSWHPLDCFEK